MYSFLNCSCMNLCTYSLSSLNKDTLSSFLIQTPLLSQLHNFILSLLASFHSVSFQIYRSTNENVLVLVFLLLLLTLLPPLLHFKSPTSLLPSSLSLFSLFLVFFLSFSSFSFFLLFFLQFLPSQFSLFWPLIFPIFFWTSCYLYFSSPPINLRIIASKPWHFQNHTSLLFSNYIYFCSLSMSLIVNTHFYYMLNKPFLIKRSIHISYVYWFFYFFQLEFLLPSKLQTHY